MNKSKIQEMLDSDNNLIGSDDEPINNPNEIGADGTTDHNAAIHGQHYTNDFLGRFGFYFYESEHEDKNNLLLEIAKMKYENFQKTIKDLGKNPKDYAKHRKTVEKKFESLSEEEAKSEFEFAKQILEKIKSNSKPVNVVSERTLTESELHKIIEDIVTKTDHSFSKKVDNDILSEKSKKILSLFHDLSDREKGELIKKLK